uniref:Uncharacterized protein n=1 Tax=Hyaloperonospora arabidopsidis (strain Emoy2) TaxID=559515 RepID=M4BQQ0_HYAAE
MVAAQPVWVGAECARISCLEGNFQACGLSDGLDGVVRLLWFGNTVIIKHPNVGRRLQCLQFGNLGHTLARCSFTDAQLRGPGSTVVTEEEVRDLDDLARLRGAADFRRRC